MSPADRARFLRIAKHEAEPLSWWVWVVVLIVVGLVGMLGR